MTPNGHCWYCFGSLPIPKKTKANETAPQPRFRHKLFCCPWCDHNWSDRLGQTAADIICARSHA